MICGIDLGSRSVKLAVMADGKLIQHRVVDTVTFYRECGYREEGQLRIDWRVLDLPRASRIVGTGYGRNNLNISEATIISELKAHTLGAVWQTGLKDFTLLDLGGQDSKVIKVRGGKMSDFTTNDKCAASTGRYLENMAAVLGMDVAELSRFRDHPAELASTCAIFGESELIGLIAEGRDMASLAAGVNHSIFRRIKPMLTSLKSDCLVFTGGVALGTAIREIIETDLGVPVIVPPYPQLNGAIGCAVYGMRN